MENLEQEVMSASVTRGRRKQGCLSRAGGGASKEVIGFRRDFGFQTQGRTVTGPRDKGETVSDPQTSGHQP